VHDQDVPYRQDEEHDAGHSHEHPPPELAALGRPLPSGPLREPGAKTVVDAAKGRVVDGHQRYFSTMGLTMR